MRLAPEIVIGVDVARRFLRGENNGDPLFHLRAKKLLRLGESNIVAGIDLQRKADGLESVVGIGVAPRMSLELDTRFLARQHLACRDEVQKLLASSARLHLLDAVRQPFRDKQSVFVVPEPADLRIHDRNRTAHVGRNRILRHIFASRRRIDCGGCDNCRQFTDVE